MADTRTPRRPVVSCHDVRKRPAGLVLANIPGSRVAGFRGGFKSYRTVSDLSSGLSVKRSVCEAVPAA